MLWQFPHCRNQLNTQPWHWKSNSYTFCTPTQHTLCVDLHSFQYSWLKTWNVLWDFKRERELDFPLSETWLHTTTNSNVLFCKPDAGWDETYLWNVILIQKHQHVTDLWFVADMEKVIKGLTVRYCKKYFRYTGWPKEQLLLEDNFQTETMKTHSQGYCSCSQEASGDDLSF